MGTTTNLCKIREPAHERASELGNAPLESTGLDLRRYRGRGEAKRREFAEMILGRTDHLSAADAALVVAVYRDRMLVRTIAELGAAAGDTANSNVPQIRRRLRRITRRCVDPLFAYVAVNIDTLQPTMRRVAVACVLHGLSLREAAISLNLSHHVVRSQREALRAIYASSTKPSRRTRPHRAPAPALVEVAQ